MATAGRYASWASLLVLSVILCAACDSATPSPRATPAAGLDLRLATTPNVQDSGLLAALLADFQQRTHYNMQTNVVSAGQALALAAQGNADVLLVDAPAAEQVFTQASAGLDRRLVLHETFALLGPASDPAHVAGLPIGAALHAIAAAGATFVSRRDGSDANLFELQHWQTVMGRDVQHEGWYVSTFRDGAATLREANRRNAYTLTDRATYLTVRSELQLQPLVAQDAGLLNPYHVIRVNPQREPGVNEAGARAFADYLVSPAGQQVIGAFGRARYGEALYTPDAGKDETQLTP